MRYLIKQLKAQKIAYLYSPHFPYFVLVNKKGNVRLLEAHSITGKTPKKTETTLSYSLATANHKPLKANTKSLTACRLSQRKTM